MAIRVLLLLLSIILGSNIIIILVSILFRENLYKKHARAITNGYGILILLIVFGYITASFLGLGK